MKTVFGVLSLLIVVAVMGILARKQLTAITPTQSTSAMPAGVAVAPSTTQQQSQQLQDQVKKSVEEALQQARPEIDEKPGY